MSVAAILKNAGTLQRRERQSGTKASETTRIQVPRRVTDCETRGFFSIAHLPVCTLSISTSAILLITNPKAIVQKEITATGTSRGVTPAAAMLPMPGMKKYPKIQSCTRSIRK